MFDENNRLEKTQDSLYSRNTKTRPVPQRKYKKDVINHQEDWDRVEKVDKRSRPEKREPLREQGPKKKNGFLTILAIISTLILIGTALFVGYRLFIADPLMSPRNVSLRVDGPATARAGDEIRLSVRIDNTNNVDLVDARLLVEFPENTRSSDSDGEEIRETMREIGVVPAGGFVEESFSMFLFGQEGEDVTTSFSLEYGSEDSNARLSNDVEHTIRISTAPITVVVSPIITEVQSGNEFEIDVDIRSNVSTRLENIVLHVRYPGGFNFISGTPDPMSSDSVWRIGTIEPQGQESITIRGFLEGQNNEEKFFNISVGQATQGESTIARMYASASESVRITAPVVMLSTVINGARSDTVSAMAGDEVSVVIDWRNTLRSPLVNLEIRAEIDERYMQPNSIRPSRGFYQSSRETVVWDRTTNPLLGAISPLSSGSESFSFRVAESNQLSGATDPEIPITIKVTARETQEGTSGRVIESELQRSVRVSSQLAFSQVANIVSGSNPPQVNTETEYEIGWYIGNSGNEAEDIVVRAALPNYVTFIPSDSPDIRFNDVTNEVAWLVGPIGSGVDGVERRSATFRIRFTPSTSQAGYRTIIVHDAVVEGRDSFTGSLLRARASSLRSISVVQ